MSAQDHVQFEMESWRRPDYVLLISAGILIVLGLNMVYSASFVVAHNNPLYASDSYFLMRQLTAAAIGLVALLFAANFDYHRWAKLALPILLVTIGLLLATIASPLGYELNGAQRWIRLGPFPSVQTTEIAKLALVIYFATWLSSRRERLGSLRNGAIPFGIVLTVVCGLIMVQPDLGSVVVIVGFSLALFFIGGARLYQLALGIIAGLGILSLLVVTSGYRAQRLAAFLSPEADPLGMGWHVIQSNIALGSGGWFGLGLGASRQKFYYLPGAHTDAIFAVIGEEIGLIGNLSTILLFAIVAWRGFRMTVLAPDTFGALLAAGITCWFSLQALVNIGGLTSLIPFTGIPLPFVSYGGSSLVMTMASVGLMLNISRQIEERRPAPGDPAAVAVGANG